MVFMMYLWSQLEHIEGKYWSDAHSTYDFTTALNIILMKWKFDFAVIQIKMKRSIPKYTHQMTNV